MRHWLQYWQLRTWINDNLCYLTINCDTGQHSQFLRCFWYIFVLTKQLCIKTVFNPLHKVSLHTYMTDMKHFYEGYQILLRWGWNTFWQLALVLKPSLKRKGLKENIFHGSRWRHKYHHVHAFFAQTALYERQTF